MEFVQDCSARQSPNTRYFFSDDENQRAYYDVTFRQDDFLVFGRETKGLPEESARGQHRQLHHDSDARDAKLNLADSSLQLCCSKQCANSVLNKTRKYAQRHQS